MLNLKFKFRKKSQKFFKNNKTIKEKFIKNIISKMSGNKNIDIKRLKGHPKLYRMRINSYRVIFKIFFSESSIIISVLDANTRSNIYKNI